MRVIAEEFDMNLENITDKDKLRDLGDSLELAQLALALEDELDVTVERNQVLQVKTVGDLIRLSEKLVTV